MVNNISKKIIKNISTNGIYNKEQLEQMEYALKIVLYELIKMLSLIAVFSIFGYFIQVIIIAGIMCIVKPFIGGYHEDTQIKCFIATVIMTVGILLLSLQCDLSFIGNCILISLSIFCIWHQAPIINSKMPITRPELIRNNRVRGLSTSIVFGALAMVLYNYSSYYSVITWTLLFEAILMFNKKEK